MQSRAVAQGAMLPPAAEDRGPPSTQGTQLGDSCCLTHLQAGSGMLPGDPRGAASAANFSPYSINHGAGGDGGKAQPLSVPLPAPCIPVLADGRAWRSRGQGVPPPPDFGLRN